MYLYLMKVMGYEPGRGQPWNGAVLRLRAKVRVSFSIVRVEPDPGPPHISWACWHLFSALFEVDTVPVSEGHARGSFLHRKRPPEPPNLGPSF